VSESERTSNGPIFPITREDTDFGLSFGHVVRASVASADDRTRNCGSETRGSTLAGRRHLVYST
jgi:hypothetical protein